MAETERSPGPDALAVLQAVAAGTAGRSGDEFFRSLVHNLSLATHVPNAFVAEFAGSTTRVRTLAYWKDGAFVANQEWDLAGTPCEQVLAGNVLHIPANVWREFPDDPGMRTVEGYLGVPLRDTSGTVLGHLAVFAKQPMPANDGLEFIFRIFAARVAAELDRLRTEARLRDSEDRYRDLFDEAPIAYVHEGLDSRFIRANRAALRILGVAPEEAVGFIGISLAPDTPDAQKRITEAFASVGRGTDASGVVLELTRKDTGEPIWIQWWSNPDPSGTYTRTMFIDITDRVLLQKEQHRLTAENLYFQEEIKSVHNFEEIVGQSPSLASVLARVARVAATGATVLINGETGTGKELIARAIHSASPRRNKSLIKLNCAALPAGLVESELFGHEPGAFTGALARRLGRFELADGGTLFLDEIGELPLEAQGKLLRVLQEQEFERLGGNASIKVDVRVIAATNRDLAAMVRDKTFREDLFYRLNVFPVALPPLRDRGGDLPLLVHFFVGKFATRIGRRIDGVAPETMELLANYHWPGNIRELENVLERAIILSETPVLQIGAEVLPATAPVLRSAPSDAASISSPAAAVVPRRLDAVERDHILAVLERTGWVIEGARGAAQVLELHPNTLRSRMKKLGLKRPSGGAA